ncbi:hypothetical protein D3C80_1560310 [compost metagenome]
MAHLPLQFTDRLSRFFGQRRRAQEDFQTRAHRHLQLVAFHFTDRRHFLDPQPVHGLPVLRNAARQDNHTQLPFTPGTDFKQRRREDERQVFIAAFQVFHPRLNQVVLGGVVVE